MQLSFVGGDWLIKHAPEILPACTVFPFFLYNAARHVCVMHMEGDGDSFSGCEDEGLLLGGSKLCKSDKSDSNNSVQG